MRLSAALTATAAALLCAALSPIADASACAPPPVPAFIGARPAPTPHVRSDLSPWEHPDELSVVYAFNRLYHTRFDPTHFAGLRALLDARATEVKPAWTTAELRWLQPLLCESAATPTITLLITGGPEVTLFSLPPWTHPSRGWLPDRPDMAPIDLAQRLRDLGFDPRTTTFQVAIDHTPISSHNTWRVLGLEPHHHLLAFNDDGATTAGDRDANEPVLLAIGDPAMR